MTADTPAEDAEKQRVWIALLANANPKICDKPYNVILHEGTSWDWIPFSEAGAAIFPVAHRQMVEGEVVFDIDGPDREKNYAVSQRIENVVKENGLFYHKFEYGGRSPHIHLFFRGVDLPKDTNNWKLAKVFFDLVLKLADVNTEKDHVDTGLVTGVPLRHGIRAERNSAIPQNLRYNYVDASMLRVFMERVYGKFEYIKQEIEDLLQEKKNRKDNFNEAILITANYITSAHHFITMRDNEDIFFFDEKIYKYGGETLIKEDVYRLWGKEANRSTVSEIIARVQANTFKNREDFNIDIDRIPCLNGIVNLITGELEPFSPSNKFTFMIPVFYNKEATCPRINAFISSVFKQEDIPLAYEIIGYCLYRRYHIQKAIMLLGGGRNGKSTFLGLLTAVLGKENITGKALQDLEKHRFAKAMLFGKLANIHADLPDRALHTTGTFKELTGGDVIDGEKKFKDSFVFTNYAKLIFSANSLPETGDDTYAFYRRWIILDFPNKFEGDVENKNILLEITSPEELSGLLNVALQALRDVLKRGDFTATTATENSRKRYLKASNSILAFIDDCIMKDPTASAIKKGTLYQEYVRYCEYFGLSIESKQKFGRTWDAGVPYAVDCQVDKEKAVKGIAMTTNYEQDSELVVGTTANSGQRSIISVIENNAQLSEVKIEQQAKLSGGDTTDTTDTTDNSPIKAQEKKGGNNVENKLIEKIGRIGNIGRMEPRGDAITSEVPETRIGRIGRISRAEEENKSFTLEDVQRELGSPLEEVSAQIHALLQTGFIQEIHPGEYIRRRNYVADS